MGIQQSSLPSSSHTTDQSQEQPTSEPTQDEQPTTEPTQDEQGPNVLKETSVKPITEPTHDEPTQDTQTITEPTQDEQGPNVLKETPVKPITELPPPLYNLQSPNTIQSSSYPTKTDEKFKNLPPPIIGLKSNSIQNNA